MSKFIEVSEGVYRGFLEEDDPEYLYIIKSGHINGQGEQNRVFYVIKEDPYEPGTLECMTKKEIEQKYSIIL